MKEKRGITKEAIRKDIQCCQKVNFVKEAATVEKKELTEEEQRKALAILNDDNFWDRFLDITERLGYVGEEENKIALYLGLTSRKLTDPINLGVAIFCQKSINNGSGRL